MPPHDIIYNRAEKRGDHMSQMGGSSERARFAAGKSMDNITIALSYDAVFDDGPVIFDKFKSTVSCLSRTDALFWCARMNLMLADVQLEDDQIQKQY